MSILGVSLRLTGVRLYDVLAEADMMKNETCFGQYCAWRVASDDVPA